MSSSFDLKQLSLSSIGSFGVELLGHHRRHKLVIGGHQEHDRTGDLGNDVYRPPVVLQQQ